MSEEADSLVAIVDAHVHIYPPDWVAHKPALLERDRYFGLLFRGPRGHMATAEDLIASMDAAGISTSVAAGFGWDDPGLCREQNDYMVETCRRYGDRILGLATLNPSRPREAAREAERALALGLAGIGELMPDGPGYSLTSPDTMDPVIGVAVEARSPVLLHVSEPVGHSYPGKGTVSPAQIIALAERHPGLTLVCAHWGGGLPFYELMPEVKRALKRVYYDTAAWPLLYRDEVFRAVHEAAPGKTLFATDYPLIGQAGLPERMMAAGLPEAAQAQALRETAMSVYSRGVRQ